MPKTRIIFQIGEYDFRKFLWFEIKGKDFYWGPSMKVAEADVSPNIKHNKLFFNKPDIYQKKDFKIAHHAYHQSGEKHYKKENPNKPPTYLFVNRWPKLNDINGIKRIYTIITKQLHLYPKYQKSLTSKRTNAIVIKINEEDSNKRFYLEFFLLPDGEFQMPETMIAMTIIGEMNYIHSDLCQEVSLFIRYLFFQGIPVEFNDLQITLTPQNL